ncbi:DMT family transporter [Chloroflexota bacterium]
MDIGLIFALLSAVSLAGQLVFIRKGTLQAGESFTAMLIFVFIGTLFFSPVLIFSVDWDKLWSLSWHGFVLLGIAGIINFVVGRLLVFSCTQFIGANKASPLVATSAFYAVIFGVLLLNEPFTVYLGLGVLGIVIGVTLVSIKKEEKTSRMRGRGILSGLAGAFCFGISGVLIKAVIEEVGSPFVSAFTSYIAAALVMGIILLLCKGQRNQLTQLNRTALIPLVLAGIFGTVGQLFRYLAYSYSPLSVVEPLLSTFILFVFFLSFLINRKIEAFTWKVFIGMMAIVAGTFLLFN